MSNRYRRADPRGLLALALLVGVFALPTAFSEGLAQSPQEYLQKMDSDHDGRVSRGEYIAYMGRNFDRIDTDGNGVLEGDELPPGARPVTRASYDASLGDAFQRQDGNHDGYLDARELGRPPR